MGIIIRRENVDPSRLAASADRSAEREVLVQSIAVYCRASVAAFPRRGASAFTLASSAALIGPSVTHRSTGFTDWSPASQTPDPTLQAGQRQSQPESSLTSVGSASLPTTWVHRSTTGDDVADLSMKVLRQLKMVTPHWQAKWQIVRSTTIAAITCKGPRPIPEEHTKSHSSPHRRRNPSPTQPAPADRQRQACRRWKRISLSIPAFAPRREISSVRCRNRSYTQRPVSAIMAIGKTGARPGRRDPIRQGPVLEWNPASRTLRTETFPIGLAFIFDPAAKLPMRVLKFEAELDRRHAQAVCGTCH